MRVNLFIKLIFVYLFENGFVSGKPIYGCLGEMKSIGTFTFPCILVFFISLTCYSSCWVAAQLYGHDLDLSDVQG
jgi:hypothetical protein